MNLFCRHPCLEKWPTLIAPQACLLQVLANVKRVGVFGAAALDSDRPMINGPEDFDARRAGASRAPAASGE